MSEDISQEEVQFIILTDEDGNEVEYEVIVALEAEDGKKYMFISAGPGDEENEDVLAFRYEEDSEDVTLFPIENEEEWIMVEAMFNSAFEFEA